MEGEQKVWGGWGEGGGAKWREKERGRERGSNNFILLHLISTCSKALFTWGCHQSGHQNSWHRHSAVAADWLFSFNLNYFRYPTGSIIQQAEIHLVFKQSLGSSVCPSYYVDWLVACGKHTEEWLHPTKSKATGVRSQCQRAIHQKGALVWVFVFWALIYLPSWTSMPTYIPVSAKGKLPSVESLWAWIPLPECGFKQMCQSINLQ